MVIFFPAGTLNERPSSHLRVYEVADELEDRGFRCIVVESNFREDVKRCFLDEAPDGTVLYVQKMDVKQLKPAHFDEHIERCKLIYDVDDHDTSKDHLGMVTMADVVVAGSTFVQVETKAHNTNVHLIHSMTDTEVYPFVDRSSKPDDMPVKIVWAEHWANAYYEDFSEIAPALRKLKEEFDIELLLQGFRADNHPDLASRPALRGMVDKFLREVPFADVDYVMPVEEYHKSGVRRLQECDIGIVPFRSGRVGKAAQNLRSFMSMGLACVASYGNDHEYVIRDGETGLLAKRTGNYVDTWYGLLKSLVQDRICRLKIGKLASESVQSGFSRSVTIEKVASLLETLGEVPEEC